MNTNNSLVKYNELTLCSEALYCRSLFGEPPHLLKCQVVDVVAAVITPRDLDTHESALQRGERALNQ